MNIAIDIQPLVSPGSKNRGIGNYSKSQLRLLLKNDKENNYILFNLYTQESIFKELELNPADYPNVKEFKIYTGNNQYIIQKSPHGRVKKYDDLLGALIQKFIYENNIDVFYFMSPFDYWDIFNIKWFTGIKTIATVYDVIPLIFMERYLDGDKELRKWYLRIIEFIKNVDLILAISNSVKEDLIKFCKINDSKIHVIYAGVDSGFKKIDIDESKWSLICKKYGITQKYIMCTGGADPRKNMNELMQAFSLLPLEIKREFQLVIVCSLDSNGYATLMQVAEKFKIADKVIITNFVPFEHLVYLYNMAYLMAFPSQYEGFGLPVVEAMACGTPVLTSSNSSLGEIAEGAAILVDPFSLDSIRKGLLEALTSEKLPELVEKSIQKVKKYTWENTVDLTISSLRSLKTNLVSTLGIEENKPKKKIAFFTPLPPQKSGISDYSYDILCILCRYFDIDIYIDDTCKSPDVSQIQNARVYNHTLYKKNSNEYYETVFQVGNSEFHTYMFQYIKQYGGIIVLHDYNLHEVIHFITGGKNDYKAYEEYLSIDYPKEAKEYVNNLLGGKTGLKFYDMPSNGIVTGYSDRIIVHSDYVKRQILKKDIGKIVKTINHYAKVETESNDSYSLRDKYKIPKDDIIIASFGFIASTKRIDKALKAFKLVAEKYKNVQYILVGKANNEMKEYIDSFCDEHGLENKVRVTGFTELSEFVNYIYLSDICINLRYPYNGETSGSLMRILAAGKAVLVSDIGSFSEIPDNCCIKIPISTNEFDYTEEIAIYEALDRLISDYNYLEKLCINSKEYSRKHLDIEKIVRQYVNFINRKEKILVSEDLIKMLFENEIINSPNIYEEIRLICESLGYISAQ